MLAETLRGLFAGTFTQIRINAFLQAFLCDYGGILCLVVDVESASALRTRYVHAPALARCKLINFTLNIINESIELIDTIVLTVSIESIKTM
jgi:hypothetical protein